MIIILLISFALSIHGATIEYIPQIIERIETAVTPDKGVAYLNCTMVISESQKSRATWYNMDEQKTIAWGTTLETPVRVDNDGNVKYIVNFIHKRPQYVPTMPGQSQDVWNYQLVIRYLLDSDSKRYMCKIDLAGFDESMKPFAIGLVVLQKAPFITPIVSQIVEEGKPLRLDCVAGGSPPPKISWVKANGEAFPLPGDPQRIQNSTLYIPKIRKDDRGVFRCHAVNNVGLADQYDVMVDVTFKPLVRQARREGAYAQMANQNFEIMVECIVNGYPDPDLYWYKGIYDPTKPNTPIMNGVRYESQKIISYGAVGTKVRLNIKIEEKQNEFETNCDYDNIHSFQIIDVFFVLKILNVQENDYGMYTCRAENRVGSDQANVTIFRQQVCQGAMCTYFQNVGGYAQVPQQIMEVLLLMMGLIVVQRFYAL